MLIQEKSQAEGPLPSSTADGSMSLLKILPSVHPNSLQNPSALQRDATSPSPASLTRPTSLAGKAHFQKLIQLSPHSL